MLLQTNSYIVPKERRADHARLIRRFRQALNRLGCDQFEVYEQVGANWSPGGANGRYVQIMRFRDRQHQQAVQAAERNDPGSQQIIAEFCELINFPYQQQHGYFATGFYLSVLPIGPRQVIGFDQYAQEEETAAEEDVAEQPSEEFANAEPQAGETEPEPASEEAAAEDEYETLNEDQVLAGEEAEEPTPAPAALAPQEELLETTEEELLEGPEEQAPETLEGETPEALEEETAENREATPAGGHSLGAFLDSLTDQDIPPADHFIPKNIAPKPVYDYEASKAPPKPAFADSSIGVPPVDETPVDLVTADAFAPAETETADEQPQGITSDEAAALEHGDELEQVEEPGADSCGPMEAADSPHASSAAAEPTLAEFEAEEKSSEDLGLIFEDETLVEATPQALSPTVAAFPAPSNGDRTAKPLEPSSPVHAEFSDEIGTASLIAPAQSIGGDNVHRDAFDALLDDTHLLGHAPMPKNNPPANPSPDRRPAVVENMDGPGDKEANLLEFEAFLRELEDPSHDHGHRSH